MSPLSRFGFAAASVGLSYLLVAVASADSRVSIIAAADHDYLRQRSDGEELKPETYVFMEGSYFGGTTVDPSIEHTTFRDLAGYLAPHLAQQQYLPSSNAEAADLVLLVHWGTTRPRVSTRDMKAWTGDDMSTETRISNLAQAIQQAGGAVPEQFKPEGISLTGDAEFDTGLTLPVGHEAQLNAEFDQLEIGTSQLADSLRKGGNMDLLGYRKEMYRLGKTPSLTEEQRILEFDLRTERYFVIVEAFSFDDIKASAPGKPRPRPVWSIHLNISSPGNNFLTAMSRMSSAGADFFGRDVPRVTTAKPKVKVGQVEILPFTILGEVK